MSILLFNQEIFNEHLLYVRHIIRSEGMAVNKADVFPVVSRTEDPDVK